MPRGLSSKSGDMFSRVYQNPASRVFVRTPRLLYTSHSAPPNRRAQYVINFRHEVQSLDKEYQHLYSYALSTSFCSNTLTFLIGLTASLSSLGKDVWLQLTNDQLRFTVVPEQGSQVWAYAFLLPCLFILKLNISQYPRHCNISLPHLYD